MKDMLVFLARLKQYVNGVPLRIKTMKSCQLEEKPFPGKWSKKEIFGHLIDSALVNLQRFQRASFETGDLVIRPYSQDDLVRENQYQEQPIYRMINLWSELNQKIADFIANRDEDYFIKKVEVPYQNISSNMFWLFEDYVNHLEHHLKQIFSSLSEVRENQFYFPLKAARDKLSGHGKSSINIFSHGTMSLKLYEIPEQDRQIPHDQDELYVVSAGEGAFQIGGKAYSCKTGDVLFAPAGVEHRFVNQTPDFETWVVFYGKKGGE